jgi:hypothetical protein
MQLAYAVRMSESARRQRRRENLQLIVDGFEGGQTGLAAATGTPKSHVSAMLAGRRGVGDALAARFARAAGKPEAWMDEVHAQAPAKAHPFEEAFRVGAMISELVKLLDRLTPEQREQLLQFGRGLEAAAPIEEDRRPHFGTEPGDSNFGGLDELQPQKKKSRKEGNDR